MCLLTSARYRLKNSIGYKEFDYNKGRLHFKFFNCYKRLPIGKWLKEEDYREQKSVDRIGYQNISKWYKTGFHIYVDNPLYAGIYSGIRKVKFRKVVAKGWQDGRKVIVAKEMYIFKK
jgi:hypothetical protein